MDKPQGSAFSGEFECTFADAQMERDLHRAMSCPLFGPCAELALKGDSVCYRFPESRFAEGAIVNCNENRLAVAAFGLHTRLHEDFPEYFRRWLYGEHNITANRVDWCFDHQAAVLGSESDLFVSVGDPLSRMSWDAARDAARVAKANGALTVLMAPTSFRFRHHVSFHPEWVVEDADCLFNSDTDDPWWSAYELLQLLTSCLRDGETPAIQLDVLRQVFASGSKVFMAEWGGTRRLYDSRNWISGNAEILKSHDIPADSRPMGMLLILEELMSKDEIDAARFGLIDAFPDVGMIEVIYRPKQHARPGNKFSGVLLYSCSAHCG